MGDKEGKKSSWSIAIPAYNEETTIKSVIEKALDFLQSVADDYYVLVVNDGSDDRTKDVLDTLSSKNRKVRVIHHPQNMGIGYAWRTLYKTADTDIIATCPADSQFNPHDFKPFLPLVEQSDIVVVCREGRSDSSWRMAISKIHQLLLKALFGLNLHDINWVKIYKKWVLKNINYNSVSPFIETELAVKAKKAGGTITEVVAPYHPRIAGKSKGGSPYHLFITLYDLLRLYPKI